MAKKSKKIFFFPQENTKNKLHISKKRSIDVIVHTAHSNKYVYDMHYFRLHSKYMYNNKHFLGTNTCVISIC